MYEFVFSVTDILIISLCFMVYNNFICIQGFYLYLYIGSMVFLLYMYAALVRDRSRSGVDSPVVASKIFSLN